MYSKRSIDYLKTMAYRSRLLAERRQQEKTAGSYCMNCGVEVEQKLAHGGHPVLRWMADNIFSHRDTAGNIKADKEKSTEKIDGIIATIMGLDRALRCGVGDDNSVYDNRGILII